MRLKSGEKRKCVWALETPLLTHRVTSWFGLDSLISPSITFVARGRLLCGSSVAGLTRLSVR